MVDREIFSRRLAALRSYLEKLGAFKRTTEEEFLRSPALHDLAERYLHLAVECALDLGNYASAMAPTRPLGPLVYINRGQRINIDMAVPSM